jgi:hypothetical protein
MKCFNHKSKIEVPCGDRVKVNGQVKPGGMIPADPSTPAPAPAGPGTELQKLLGRIGLGEKSSCQCKSRARLMDAKGPEWCRDNLDTIVGWLREEAQKRGLPFLETGARLMVKLAIRRASAS